MPAESSVQPRRPTAGDIFVEMHRTRDEEPGVGIVYGPADFVLDGAGVQVLNGAGQPRVQRWEGATYSINLSMGDPLARDRLIAMELRVRDLCQAGHLADDAEAIVAYELLDEVRAAGSLTVALETLGVRVFGPGTPFITSAPEA